MKKKIHYLFLAFLSLLSVLPGQSIAQETKIAYAMNDNEESGKGIYSFELSDTISNLQLIQPMSFEWVSGGLLVGETYYYMEYRQTDNGYESVGFYSYDMESKSVKQIADYGSTYQGPIASCLSYDYQQGVMYGLNGFNGGDNLVKIDLETGTISNVGELKFDVLCDAAKNSTMAEKIHVMTSTYDGELYGVSYWGALYKINQYTAQCQYIGTLDYNPGDAFMYTSDCLFYDNDTNQLYLRFATYNWDTASWLYEIVKIDKQTAKVTPFVSSKATNGLNCISVPFTVAEASAPAKVQNLSVTRGNEGTLEATVEWDNPDKTYGRGGTLEELDYVLVYRNDVLTDSITNPTIGGHQVWTDNNITERGYYTYRIVPGNSMGRGDRATTGTYVGKGDPLPVSDLKAERNGDGVKLSWTAPTEGRLESYIDVSTLNYDIVRFKNSETTGETIAKGVKQTEYEDNSLTELARYTYMVTPNTDNAKGDSVKTNAEMFGPAIALPHTFAFKNNDEFLLWTTIDANGNYSTWQWTAGGFGSPQGAVCQYNYDELAAADWLISPRIKFEAGKRYKVTFDATPGNKKVIETLAISFGKGTDIAQQDSINQFEIISDKTVRLRANLPEIQADDEYNIGFLYRSYHQPNYNLTIGNIEISEDHEGYVEGTVVCGGKPVAGATVLANGGEFVATTDENGKYKLNYLPAGEHHIDAFALGYENVSVTVNVTELQTTTCDIQLTALPEYTVKGTVKDVVGDPVAGAKVVLSGYDNKETETATDGSFSIENVFKNSNYCITVSKNKLLDSQKNFGVEAETDLGTIVLEDNQKPAGKISVTEDGQVAEVSWKAPANDAVVQRIDDGTLTTAVGIESSTENTMFGVVKREPSSVTGVEFYIDGTASVTHYSVRLNIFDLDENGEPTDKLLYQNTYVPATDGQWNSYTLPAPVDAPNGYYIALSSYDYMLVGIDGAGDSEKWPFVEGVNCFTPDYTSGQYLYLEGQTNADFHHNFLIRPIAAPHYVPEDSTEFKSNAGRFIYKRTDNPQTIELTSKTYDNNQPISNMGNGPMYTPQSRIRYNVYRMAEADINDESKWTLMSEKQQERTFTDKEWSSLEQGTYAYAVKSVYTGDNLAEASMSEMIGNKMLTKLTFNITTETPDNEAYGTKVTLVHNGGERVYEGYAGNNGTIVLEDVWKTTYDVTVSLDGFISQTGTIDVSKDNEYSFSYNLEENRIKPYNLVIDEAGSSDSRLFIWNYPDYFREDFEGHEDFAINSPGTIGWQYIDGDQGETGGFGNVTWPGQFAPMAFIVFNQNTTTPSIAGQYLLPIPMSGDKMITDWASYGVQNDDWIITPKLYFQKDFKFSFNASSSDYNYLESIEVGYSTTDTDPSSFTMVQDSIDVPAYWQKYTYDIPAEAKYVAIRCISKEKRILSIDDIEYGLTEALDVPAYLRRPAAARGPQKSPAIDGLYEIYLDGEKVAQQDETQYTFTGLSSGIHTAGVLASYTSGKTEMSTIDFEVTSTGINTIAGSEMNISIKDGKLTVSGGCDKVEMFNVNGSMIPVSKTDSATYNVGNVTPGVYMLRITKGNNVKTIKTIIK